MKLYKQEDLQEVKEALLCGKIIAFPTDTVFGLACIYGDEEAKDKIYEAKNRSIDKKLPMMVNGFDMLSRYCELTNAEKKLLDTFTPGPITLILKYKDKDETVAIRIPNDTWILKLIQELDKPLLVTSANISGNKSLMKYEDVIQELNERVDGIVCADAAGEVASTIVDCLHDYKILRQGPISKDSIDEALKGEE